MQNLTPLMTQYQEIKSSYQDAVLLFQMGDFFECFGDDAVKVSEILGIVLTKREKKSDAPPMAGFPIKALDDYLPKLVKTGQKVAIARQMEPPSGAKGIVRRAVTEVITQGTITTQEGLLSHDKNYLAAIVTERTGFGLTVADVTTGELKTYQSHDSIDKLVYLLEKLAPREVIISADDHFQIPQTFSTVIQPLSKKYFEKSETDKLICAHFKVKNLDALGLTEFHEASRSAGAIISYITETKKTDPLHLTNIEIWNPDNSLIIDPTTQRNLELFYNLRTHQIEGSLMEIIDRTVTHMGHRLLYSWVSFPLTQEDRINERLDVLEFFSKKLAIINDTAQKLKEVPDIERLSSLIGLGRIHPKQVLALAKGLNAAKDIVEKVTLLNPPVALKKYLDQVNISELSETITTISSALVDSLEGESGLFQKGFNTELDELIILAHDGNKLIKEIFQREKDKSGIANLKLGFNRVFGYYFETSRGNAKYVPEHFIKKQTLVNADRYITEEVKNLEVKVLSAQENLSRLEEQLFTEFVQKLQSFIPILQTVALFIAHYDVFTSLTLVAASKGYSRPEVGNSTDEIQLIDAVHPVVANHVQDFVPNSISIARKQNFVIITGPNMGGKSTFVRQIALIHILAQIGSYVPAKKAHLRIIDKIFARIGASDDISTGRSTFMVELSEVANIVKHATKDSLVILDEVGRGTSTYEGISIAWGISEYIAKEIGCTTIFTTHFREITELESQHSEFINYKVNIHEENNDVYFLHTITKGISDKSYGIHVAKLVDLPSVVIKRAAEVLEQFESKKPLTVLKRSRNISQDQLTLLAAAPVPDFIPTKDTGSEILKELKNVNIDLTTPMDALQILSDLKRKADE